MPVCEDEADCAEALAKFFHEMGAEPTPQPKLSVTTELPAQPRRPRSSWSRAASRSDRSLRRPSTAGAAALRAVDDHPAALDHGPREVGAGPVRDLA